LTSPYSAIQGHFETILPFLFRKTELPESIRGEIPLRDGDFVDAEYWAGSGNKTAILTHGLEGSSKAGYIQALTRLLMQQGWSVLAWNFRGCSGRQNRLPRLYHSGAYEDLIDVITWHADTYRPQKVSLYGFSLGGNLTLVAAAKQPEQWFKAHKIDQITAISAPLDLAGCATKLGRWWNYPYAVNFLMALKRKVTLKANQFPDPKLACKLKASTSIIAFDDHFTAPMHGFTNAADYYRQCSSRFMLHQISVPTRIIIAKNDPMLARGFLKNLKIENPLVKLELLPKGGHCGFWNEESLWV